MTLTIGAGATVFYGLSTLSNGILQAIGAVKIPLHNALKALIAHILIIMILLLILPASNKELAPYLLAIGTSLYALQMCITNQLALKKLIHYRYKTRKFFLIPIISSIIMGMICYISYQLLFMITRHVFIPLIISVIIGMIVYFLMILFFYSDHLDDLNSIPYMNRLLRKLNKH